MIEDEKIFALLRATRQIFQSFEGVDYANLASPGEAPVAAADKKIGNHLAQGLRALFPDDALDIEDAEAASPNSSQAVWMVDPIDGTVPFLAHIPTYMTSICKLQAGQPVVTYVYDPVQDIIYVAQGNELFANGQRLAASEKSDLSAARVALPADALRAYPALFQMLSAAGAYVIPQEGLLFRSLLVAAGYIDATVQPTLRKYEAGAVQLCVTAAGGLVLDTAGTPPNVEATTNDVIISNRYLAKDLQAILRSIL